MRGRMMDSLSRSMPLSVKDFPRVQKADELGWSLRLNDKNVIEIRERFDFTLLEEHDEKKIWMVDGWGVWVGRCASRAQRVPVKCL